MTYKRSGAARDRRRRLSAPRGMSLNKCRACGAANPSALGEPIPETCASCGSPLAQEVKVHDKSFEPMNRDGVRVRRPRAAPKALTHKTVGCARCGGAIVFRLVDPEPACPSCGWARTPQP